MDTGLEIRGGKPGHPDPEMFGLSGLSMVQCNMSVYCYSKSARNDTLEEIIY